MRNQKLSVLKNLFFTVIVTLLLHAVIRTASAQVTFDPVSNVHLNSCDDFATLELNNPWDMSDTADINNYFKGIDVLDFTNPRIETNTGLFKGKANSGNSTLYLISPVPCGAHPVSGRYGQQIALNTSKYTRLSIRMYTDVADPHGMSLIWDRSCNYANARTLTADNAIPTKVGWHTYTIDLNSIGRQGSDTRPWSAGSITGLAIKPTVIGNANIIIDWVRLEDPTSPSCSLGTVSSPNSFDLNPATNGNNDLYSVYLVKDNATTPYSSSSDGNGGFIGEPVKVALPADSTPIAVSLTNPTGTNRAIEAGTYKLAGVLDSDYATLELNNPWDFADAGDYKLLPDSITPRNLRIEGGTLKGTARSGDKVFLSIGAAGIDTAKYSKFSVSGSWPSLRVNTAGGSQAIANPNGSVTPLILNGIGSWGTGTIHEIQLEFPTAGDFELKFVSLRKSGSPASSAEEPGTTGIITYSDPFFINRPPLFAVDNPSTKGGESLRAWNMNPGDFNVFGQLTSGTDPARPSEPYTAYLPDVRYVDGHRGDFFKGTSLQGSDDPTNYSTFIHAPTNNFYFSADEYRNLCFKLNIEKDFDLGGGSVARVIWKAINQNFTVSEDLVLIYDNWKSSRWHEYCMDLTTIPPDGGTSSTWTGQMEAFRVDPHEFNVQTTYYFDWIKLKKDARAPGKYNIAYSFSDPDSAASTLKFYYSVSNNSFNPANIIATVSSANASRVITWDTSAVPAGTYYIHATADDGTNLTTRYSTARIMVSPSGDQGSAPILSLEAPSASVTTNVCDSLQIKGFALQPDRLEDVSVVEVQIDGNYFASISPSDYNGIAKQTYPAVDSSNSGFNKLFDASGISTGTHTVTITAYSTHGPVSSVSRSINKTNSGCQNPVVDTDPAGAPVAADVSPPPAPTATPRPTATPSFIKVKSVKHTSTGAVTVAISGLSSKASGCKVQLLGRVKQTDKATLLLSSSATAADIKKKQMTFTRTRLFVNKKAPAAVYLSTKLSCKKPQYGESSQRKMTLVRKTAGVKTGKDVLTGLKRLVKVKVSTKKKN